MTEAGLVGFQRWVGGTLGTSRYLGPVRASTGCRPQKQTIGKRSAWRGCAMVHRGELARGGLVFS